MPRGKDWYWEAEQERIAADPDLRLVPSPDGWPSEGLDSVGLYFLLMNLMWMSPKTGYLCDPVQTDLPLKPTELGRMIGRDVQVVERVLKVILDRKMFSKTPEGIIFSRGILRKVSLRKKRASAGRKGGKASQSLLKQTVEQKGEQTVGIGLGISLGDLPLEKGVQGEEVFSAPPFVAVPDELSSHGLAVKWCFLRQGKGKESPQEASETFAGMIASGVPAQALNDEMSNRPDKAEYLWEFRRRLMARFAGRPQPISPDEQNRKLREAMERQRKLMEPGGGSK